MTWCPDQQLSHSPQSVSRVFVLSQLVLFEVTMTDECFVLSSVRGWVFYVVVDTDQLVSISGMPANLYKSARNIPKCLQKLSPSLPST